VVTTHHPLLLEAADWVVDMAGGTVATVRVQPGNAAAARQRAAAEACNELRAGDVNDSAAVDGQVAEATAGAAAGADAQAASEQQQAKEERQQGHVRLEVYQRYAAATGWGWATVILLSLLLMQASKHRSIARGAFRLAGRSRQHTGLRTLPCPSSLLSQGDGLSKNRQTDCARLTECPSPLLSARPAGQPQRQRPLALTLGLSGAANKP
jgi:hypothetical protein